jgi:hypothetical protein
MARMQKMPMPKVPAKGSITDKMKKQPLPVRPMPKQVPGGMVKKYQGNDKKGLVQGLNNLKSNRKLQGAKKANPRGGTANPRGGMVSAAGNSKSSMNIQKAGPSANLRNIQKGSRPTLRDRNKQAPNFKGVMAPGKKPITRPVQPPRRGSR